MSQINDLFLGFFVVFLEMWKLNIKAASQVGENEFCHLICLFLPCWLFSLLYKINYSQVMSSFDC